jgi:hypothetical protein
MTFARASMVAVLAALALAAQSSAGGIAIVQLSSTPTGVSQGETWAVDLTILQHGRRALDGLSPTITVHSGDRRQVFPARPTGEPGTYRAEVVFPSAGTWRWEVWDGFTQTHTYAPVEIRSPAGGSRFVGGWPTPLAVAAGLVLAGAALIGIMRRRSRPARLGDVA